MLRDVRGRPSDELLRRAMRGWAIIVPRPEPRLVLTALRLNQDGAVGAAETQRHKHKVLANAMRYAVEQRKLPADPLAPIKWSVAETVDQVDPRVVANPSQARSLLCAVSYVGGYRRARGRRPVGLFAGMYYAGLRPAEAVGASLPNCVLPAEGWGQVTVHRTLPQAGKRWTDSGRAHDERGLKGRPADDTRPVPLPPELVALWRESIDIFGTAQGLFGSPSTVVKGTRRIECGRRSRALGRSLLARWYPLTVGASSGPEKRNGLFLRVPSGCPAW
jgi:hypothetical protein